MTCLIAFAGYAIIASHVPQEPPLLLRAAVVAGRATVVLANDQPLGRPIDLIQARCDGPGQAVLACVELASPWRQTVLIHPAMIRIGNAVYPRTLLRHSYSAYGVMVIACSSIVGPAPLPTLCGASLPRLEVVTQELNHHPARFGLDLWNNLNRDSCFLHLIPLMGLISENLEKPPIHYDFLISQAAECELFIGKPNDSIVCQVNSVLASQQIPANGNEDRKPWQQRYAVPGLISGPFAVVPHGKARYLVTALARSLNSSMATASRSTKRRQSTTNRAFSLSSTTPTRTSATPSPPRTSSRSSNR